MLNCYKVVGVVFFVIACQMPLLFAWVGNQPWAEGLLVDRHTASGIERDGVVLVFACFLNIALFLGGGIAAFVRASEIER